MQTIPLWFQCSLPLLSARPSPQRRHKEHYAWGPEGLWACSMLSPCSLMQCHQSILYWSYSMQLTHIKVKQLTCNYKVSWNLYRNSSCFLDIQKHALASVGLTFAICIGDVYDSFEASKKESENPCLCVRGSWRKKKLEKIHEGNMNRLFWKVGVFCSCVEMEKEQAGDTVAHKWCFHPPTENSLRSTVYMFGKWKETTTVGAH